MKEPVLLSTGFVPVADIEVRGRLRPVSEAGVAALMASIAELGVMKDPIDLRKVKDGRLVLVAGGHRLEAARRRGKAEIRAKVWGGMTDDQARLMEIDDNLAGAEMSPLDTAVFLATRKALYEKLHPETRRGVAGALRRWDATATESVAFVQATAAKFSLSVRHVYRLAAAGSALAAPDIAALRSAGRPVTLKDLSELSKLDAPTRYDAVRRFAEGKSRSIAEARRALKSGAAPDLKDRAEADFKALSAAWTRAGIKARKRFLLEFAAEIWRSQNAGVPLPHWQEAAE